MSLVGWFISPYLYLLTVFYTFEICVLHISWNVNQNRARSACGSNVKCFSYNPWNICGVLNQIRMLGKWLGGTGNICLLKSIRSNKISVNLPCNGDKWNRIQISGSDSSDHIGCSWTRGCQTDAYLAGLSWITAGVMWSCLFIPDQHMLDGGFTKRFVQGQQRTARITEDDLHILFLQTL